MTACRICKSPTETIFESSGGTAVTSGSIPVPGKVVVDLCPCCGHCQTRPLADLHKYYASEYRFKLNSAEEDDLYESKGGEHIFRSEHQANIVADKFDLSHPAKVLDYGSGKALSLRKLFQENPEIIPYVFDVSEDYTSYWDEFVPRSSQACFTIPDEWNSRFDIALAFFALEHVVDVDGFLDEMFSVIRPGGEIFIVVPNMLENASDLVVADHVNHFSEASLAFLLRRHGFNNVEIDTDSFRGAFVATAVRGDVPESSPSKPADGSTQAARAISEFWRDVDQRVRNIAASQPEGRSAAIYGSGIYGLFIASVLAETKSVSCFLDQNPFRQGYEFFGIPVVAPESVPDDADLIYVALNPTIAREVISGVPALHRVPRSFFYL